MAVYDDYVFNDYSSSGVHGYMQIDDYTYSVGEVPGHIYWYKSSAHMSLVAGTTITLSLDRAIRTWGVEVPVASITIDGEVGGGYTVPFPTVSLNLVRGWTTVEEPWLRVTYDATQRSVSISILQDIKWIEVRMGACRAVDLSNCVVGCSVIDQVRASYDSPLSKIPYKGLRVNNMDECFKDCDSLIIPPPIPDSVYGIVSCFDGCRRLEQAPVIPDSVQFVNNCFKNCTSLTGDVYVCGASMNDYLDCFVGTTKPIYLRSVGNKNAELLTQLAGTANNNNVLINIHPESPITFADAQMNYMTEQGLVPLSLQTNANLVQCEVPDLANGGTIITNVNDALIDLYNRGAIGGGA